MPETTLPARPAWKCNRCQYVWPKKKKKDESYFLIPTICAGCHNPYWNTPRLK